jgi:ribonuclease-3
MESGVFTSLQNDLKYQFNNQALLEQALTHSSFVNESQSNPIDNERLEFLGDAVLDCAVAALLFCQYPTMNEGELTRIRAALVKTEHLAGLARRYRLGHYLRLGKGEQARPRILCAAFEAVLGAMYLDGGFQTVQAFLHPLLSPLAATVLAEQGHLDSKSQLQEWSQAQLGQTPAYHILAEAGPDHAKSFTIEVRIAGERYGVGSGHSKRDAAQAAARLALQQVQSQTSTPTLQT